MDPPQRAERFKRVKRVKTLTRLHLAVQQQEVPPVNPNSPPHQWNEVAVPLVNPNLAVQQQQEQDPEVPLRQSQRARKRPWRDDNSETELFADIAKGLEAYEIPVYGPFGVEPPLNFNYINEMRYGGPRVVQLPTGHTPCICVTRCGAPCACVGRCVPGCGSQCACLELNGTTHPYRMVDGVRRLRHYRHMIFECNKCSCDRNCDMRLSQRENFELELYHTGAKGFGVRSLGRIPRGACIGEYLGDLRIKEYFNWQSDYTYEISCLRELRKDAKAAFLGQPVGSAAVGSRGEDLVLMIGDNESWRDAIHMVDALEFGNVTRFINHSCNPNSFAQPIVYPTDEMPLSATLARIVIFASKDIEAWEEITIDYNSHSQTQQAACLCGSDNCRRYLW